MRAKNAIRDVVKALDLGGDWDNFLAAKQKNPNLRLKEPDTKYSLQLSDVIAKQIPEGPDVSLENAMRPISVGGGGDADETVDKLQLGARVGQRRCVEFP